MPDALRRGYLHDQEIEPAESRLRLRLALLGTLVTFGAGVLAACGATSVDESGPRQGSDYDLTLTTGTLTVER